MFKCCFYPIFDHTVLIRYAYDLHVCLSENEASLIRFICSVGYEVDQPQFHF